MSQAERFDAVYRLETPVKSPHCGETVSTLKAVRMLRDQGSGAIFGGTLSKIAPDPFSGAALRYRALFLKGFALC